MHARVLYTEKKKREKGIEGEVVAGKLFNRSAELGVLHSRTAEDELIQKAVGLFNCGEKVSKGKNSVCKLLGVWERIISQIL